MDSQIAGIAALYAVVELVKFFLVLLRGQELTPENQQMLKDLHNWHSQKDDDGRMIWYIPKGIHEDQEKILDTLRKISSNQETIARLLGELARDIKRN